MTTLYAGFEDAVQARDAMTALIQYGVHADDVSLVMNEPPAPLPGEAAPEPPHGAAYGEHPAMGADRFGSDSFGVLETESAYGAQGLAAESEVRHAAEDSHAENDAAAGAGVGLGVGVLAGLASLFVPGFGFVLGGGGLAAAIGAAAVTTGGGALAGAVIGAMHDEGIEDDAAQTYGSILEHGGGIVSVRVPSRNVGEQTVRSILLKNCAGALTSAPGPEGFVV